MMKFTDIRKFAAHYSRKTRKHGVKNDRELTKAQVGCLIPRQDSNVLFLEDDFVRVLVSLDSKAMVIERKENDNPVYWRTCDGKVARTHGEWVLCQEQ